MTPQEFQKRIQSMSVEIKKAIDVTIPRKVANTAVLHFKQSFQDEGFTDEKLEKWKEVKRRQSPSRADLANANLPILTGTGDLGRSIQSKVEPGKVTVISDVPYAKAHKDGFSGTVSVKAHERKRKDGGSSNIRAHSRNANIPKRQFIGDSKVLDDKIKNVITDELDKILGA